MDTDMDTEERLKALEDEFQIVKKELKQILLDIRTYLMEASSPLRGSMNRDNFPGRNNSDRG